MKKFIQGMVKDPERVDQPDGTYRDALNANIYFQKGAIANELGTTPIAFDTTLINNVIGRCVLEDGRIVVFGKIILSIGELSDAILLADPVDNTLTVLYRDNDLNFQIDHTIEATAKVGNNNDILVYFTDNYVDRRVEEATGISYLEDYNPPRVFNITKQLKDLTDPTILYNNSSYNVDKLDLFLHTGEIPRFNDIRIEEGGGVVSGTYHLALAYVDDESNVTNYMATSNAVHLVTAPEDAIPTETITGDPQGTQSNKSIIWEVIIPANINYTFVQPVIIQRFGGLNQESSEFAYSLQKISIPDSFFDRKIEITYTGLENVAQASVSDIVIDRVRYESAKTLVQLDNRLYLANLESRGDIGYQRFANRISVEPVLNPLRTFDPRYFDNETLTIGYKGYGSRIRSEYNIQKLNGVDARLNSNVKKGYKDSNLSYRYKSFRRSEVYAFYISFVLKDGTETYAYHIPGRKSISDGRTDEMSSIADNFDAYPNLQEFHEYYPDAKMYQVVDTHIDNGQSMGYWENTSEQYPETSDFEQWTVLSNGSPSQEDVDIQGENVRHHKMPSNKSEYSYIDLNDGELNPESSPVNVGATTMVESIQILGIKLNNIRIPKFMLKQIQGYKVYYAKRKQEHKTIIGQSAIIPAAFKKQSNIATSYDTAKTGPFNPAWLSLGHIPPSTLSYVYSTNLNGTSYKGVSAFGFHDFNLLKNKHTLTGATHIDIQKVMIMKMWAGTDQRTPDDNGDFYIPEWVSAEMTNANDDSTVKLFGTSALLAHSYDNPSDLSSLNVSFADFKHSNITEVISDLNSIYTIRPKSITYLPGLSILDNDKFYSFQNADTIFNFAGETQIFINTVTGPPAIMAWSSNEAYSSSGVLADWWNAEKITRRKELELLSSEYTEDDISTYPVTYLANLVSYKTDVFKPFDEQNLVWTGYYKPISADIDTGAESKAADDGKDNNYYQGAESDSIFGGDTYIGRYGFRTTGQTYGGAYNNDTSLFDLNDPDSNDLTVGNRTPISTLYYFICESDDLLGFRHAGDNQEGVTTAQSKFFDNEVAADVIFNSPLNDGTKQDNLLYMNNYSLNQDIRVARPYPKTYRDVFLFPTRTIRSNNDEGSVQDKYRQFLALEYKDIPRNRGDVVKLFSLGGVLYLNSERSLFVTRGKENLQLSGGTQAFVGSGDIFSQDPEELISTNTGYGGTDSQFTGVTTRYGHFYFNRRDRKAYILTESIIEASSAGMEKWFLENSGYVLEEEYNISLIQAGFNIDSPTSSFGFHAGYDPKYKRILLTKKERVPNNVLIGHLNAGRVRIIDNRFIVQQYLPGIVGYSQGDVLSITDDNMFESSGWTLSYYPEIKVWGSRHSYLPTLYCNTAKELYSFTNYNDIRYNAQIWEHSNVDTPCTFYNTEYNFEFEYIDNTSPAISKIFSSLYYWGELQVRDGENTEFHKVTTPIFSSYYVYNSTQISGENDITALVNTRLVDRIWYINDFRDLTRYENTLPVEINMFVTEGVINPLYLDYNKSWYHKKRFVDTYLGVRLISNNNRNLIYLYGAGTKHRQSYR